MKTKKIITIALMIFGAIALSTFTSCKKKGCTDKNADNYNPDAEKSDGSCIYRYASGILVSVPAVANYDPFDGPDLYVQFKKKSSSTWDYVTNTGSNSYSTSLTVPANIMFTNEDWEFEIYDHDTADPDDFIISGTFNPLQNKDITLTGSGVSITFQYTTK